jgi:pimeloyl-ACP methyl ester carboxylesterase
VKRLPLALAAILALLASCAHRDIEAGLLLADLSAGGQDSALKHLTTQPERRPISYDVLGRHRTGDLYLPGEPAKAALVLVPGAARTGKDDPRLVAFALSLARARWQVLVPDIPGMRRLEVSAEDEVDVADAVRQLSPEWNRVAVVAVSYAAGPAVLAALEPDVAPHVGLLVAIGPPYDLVRVITFFTTGFVREQGTWRYREPNAYGKWVFVNSNAGRLDDSADRVLLGAIAERKLADLAAPVDDLTARLGPQGRTVMALLDNRDPERVPALIQALPPRLQDEIQRLDLSRRDLSGLEARVMVIHGRDDRIVPAEEGAALAQAVPRGELYLPDSLAHADLNPGGTADTYLLWRAVVHLLEERDRLGP